MTELAALPYISFVIIDCLSERMRGNQPVICLEGTRFLASPLAVRERKYCPVEGYRGFANWVSTEKYFFAFSLMTCLRCALFAAFFLFVSFVFVSLFVLFVCAEMIFLASTELHCPPSLTRGILANSYSLGRFRLYFSCRNITSRFSVRAPLQSTAKRAHVLIILLSEKLNRWSARIRWRTKNSQRQSRLGICSFSNPFFIVNRIFNFPTGLDFKKAGLCVSCPGQQSNH